MKTAILVLLSAVAAFAADDPWTKVRELKGGAECRVTKTGVLQPLIVKFDEATDENLLVVLKNEQVAIPRDEIDRIECRPVKQGSRLRKETKVTSNERRAPEPNSTGPSQSVSSGLSIEGKPDFELIYRRRLGAPKK